MKIDFYGNKQTVELVEKALESKRFSHAYLFYGPDGCGKRTLAKQFAQGILCKGENSPCGQCSSCKKAQNETHPDLTILSGEGGKNSFHVEKIRKVRSDAYIQPNDGKYKVFLLSNIENMSISAANSLLKVLEEPPAYVIFILTCSSHKSIPSTIVSRCVPLGVFPVSSKECTDALRKINPDINSQQIEQAANLSGGSIGLSLEFLHDSEFKKTLETALEIKKGLTAKNELDIIVAMGVMENSRDTAKQVLICLNKILGLELENRYLDNQFSALYPSDSLSVNQIIEVINTIKTCIEQLEYNGNLKLILTWMSSRTGEILQKIN